MSRGRLFVGAAMAALFSSGAAWAQSAANAPTAALEEVIVTAQKREERLQETPVSVTAFTAAAMERQGIEDINDVALRTPGMQYGDFGDVKLSPTSLRGIVGSATSAGADPAVGYYVDEVFLGQGPGANLDLYDIARVEVLRGPQGTLFGRNTIGGVINITTERPTGTFTGSATLNFGNYDFHRGAVSVSGPLLHWVSGKIFLQGEEREGTTENVWLGNRVNSRRNWSTRGQLLFDLGGPSELLVSADYREVNQAPLGFETLSYSPDSPLPLLAANGLPINTNPFDYQISGDQQNVERLKSGGVAANFRSELDGVRLTNILSYHRHDYFSRVDTDRSALSVLYDGDPEKVWRWSEEFRAEFNTGPVDWITGLYYFRQSSRNQSFVEVGKDLAGLLGDPTLTGLRVGSNGKLDTRSAAAFISATWKVTDRFDVTGGIRYTREKKAIAYTQTDSLGLLGGNADIHAAARWSQVTPSFNARYHFTPDILAYVTVSKGFKSGGFNDALGDANGIAFGPEQLWSYESGLKTELFEHRLVFNATLYRMDWKHIQIEVDNPATPIYDPIILNAGAAHSQGVELEAQAKPTLEWTLGASLSVQEAKYDQGSLPTGQPLARIPDAPNYTFDLNAEYRFETRLGAFYLYGEYIGRGESFLTPDNQPDGKVNPYGLVDARLTWEPTNSHVRVSLWGKNLTDEAIKQRLFDLSGLPLIGQKFIVLSDPTTFGVEVNLKY